MKDRHVVRLIMIVPLGDLIRDVAPLDTLCQLFDMKPKKLIEHLVLEWMKYQNHTGQYAIAEMFGVGESAVLEFIKGLYVEMHDRMIGDEDVRDLDRVIDLIGQSLFDIMRHYLDAFELEAESIHGLEILHWVGDNLVLKCS